MWESASDLVGFPVTAVAATYWYSKQNMRERCDMNTWNTVAQCVCEAERFVPTIISNAEWYDYRILFDEYGNLSKLNLLL